MVKVNPLSLNQKDCQSGLRRKNNSKPINYSLFDQKLTFEFLKSHLWAAADILRGSLDPADYRRPYGSVPDVILSVMIRTLAEPICTDYGCHHKF